MIWLICGLALLIRVIMAVPLYYYTSSDNFELIFELGLIWTDAGFAGHGVYLTEIPPTSGRMTIAQHLYKNQDGYTMTEVCLETNSGVISVEKLLGYPRDKIWMSATQLGLNSFSVSYIATPDSLWKRNEVKSFIKEQHITLNPYNKSPISQLQEMVVRSGLRPLYSERFDGKTFVCNVSLGSESVEGKGNTKQMAKTEAAKQLLRRLILGQRENPATEIRHVYLSDENNISVTVDLNKEEATLCNAVDDMFISDNNSEIFNATGLDVSANYTVLPKRHEMLNVSSEIKNVCSSHEPDFNPIGKLQEHCVNRSLPLPEYVVTPLVNNTGGNNFTVIVKVGDLAGKGSGWTKKIAKKAAAEDVLHKLGIFSLDNVREHQVLCRNTSASAMSRDRIEAQSYQSSTQVPSNPVGKLQEVCVAERLPLPEYKEVSEKGVPHAKTFTIQCSVREFTEYGTGSSKKDAKHDAALKMLKNIKS